MAVINIKRQWGDSDTEALAGIVRVIGKLIDGLTYFGADRVFAGTPTFIQGTSDAAKVKVSTPFTVLIDGEEIWVPIQEIAVGAPGVITNVGSKWGAWRIEILKTGLGVCTPFAAAMADASATAAFQHLGALARTAHAHTAGFLVVQSKNGGADFTGGTTALAVGADCTALSFYDVHGYSGMTTAVTLKAGAATEKISRSALNYKRYGQNLAVIALDAAMVFTVADTVTTLKYGGWLIITDLAGTGVLTLKATGVAAVGLQAYATRAACDAALDLLEANLPKMYGVAGRLVIKAGAPAPWTANTDDLIAGSDSAEVYWTPKVPAASTVYVPSVIVPSGDVLNVV